MRYIDCGRRHEDETLGRWLVRQVPRDAVEVRCQTGFFRSDSLVLLTPLLEQAAAHQRLVRVLIGSNDQSTSRDDVRRLYKLLGLPRPNAEMAVVSFGGGAYFHPKVLHFRLADGTQLAYVGSANVTSSGVSGLHVEAGMLLDSRSGDSVEELGRIAAAVDAWFDERRPGLEIITAIGDLDRLVAEGILSETSVPRVVPSGGGSGGRPWRPGLKPLLVIPTAREPEPPPAPALPSIRGAAPRPDFPAYLLFRPGALGPTTGRDAVTGASLPSGAEGLIIRINRDSARHFFGGAGTSNVSIPVATLAPIRFGIFEGKHRRARAEFPLRIRHISSLGPLTVPVAETNVMSYGFAAGESGHGDIRMLVPAAVKTLADDIRQQGLPVPAAGDLALLEWPRQDSAEFRLTYMQMGSELGGRARELFDEAVAMHEVVGEGAAWLPSGLSPDW